MSDHQTPAELEADIEAQRQHLAETVDQLAYRLDVTSRARERAARLADRATDDAGRPRPEVVASAALTVVLIGVLVWWRRR